MIFLPCHVGFDDIIPDGKDGRSNTFGDRPQGPGVLYEQINGRALNLYMFQVPQSLRRRDLKNSWTMLRGNVMLARYGQDSGAHTLDETMVVSFYQLSDL